MRQLLDMGVSPKVADRLCFEGHDAVHLATVADPSSADSEVLAFARREGRVLLTHDLDFGNLMAVRQERDPSVVVFRLRSMKPDRVLESLLPVLREHGEVLLEGCFVVVAEGMTRIRTLPSS